MNEGLDLEVQMSLVQFWSHGTTFVHLDKFKILNNLLKSQLLRQV